MMHKAMLCTIRAAAMDATQAEVATATVNAAGILRGHDKTCGAAGGAAGAAEAEEAAAWLP
jgi:hypothetical protein